MICTGRGVNDGRTRAGKSVCPSRLVRNIVVRKIVVRKIVVRKIVVGGKGMIGKITSLLLKMKVR